MNIPEVKVPEGKCSDEDETSETSQQSRVAGMLAALSRVTGLSQSHKLQLAREYLGRALHRAPLPQAVLGQTNARGPDTNANDIEVSEML